MSKKRFRHRFNFALYDDTFLDSEIVDYLSSHDAGHARQEAIRSLLRAGFSSLIKNNDKKQATLDSIDPNVLAAALQVIGNVNQQQVVMQPVQQVQVSHQEPAKEQSKSEAPVETYKHQSDESHKIPLDDDSSVSEASSDNSNEEFESKIKIDESKKFTPTIDESTYETPENVDENRDMSVDLDDDDIVDPMSMFGDDSGEGGMF